MKNAIRILLLEDNATDADLIRRTLKRAGLQFDWKHVDHRSAFILELDRFGPTLIFSDFSLPSFDGYTALAIAREKCPDVPFIFVTGTLGEEVAIETLKKGATDYVLKHRLTRLVPSLHRALREAEERAERKRAEEQLRHSHEQLRALSMHLQDVREEERMRIAREVHDELGQALTGLKLQLTWLANRLPKRPRRLHDIARLIADRIDTLIQTVRRIATELRPGVLDSAGLLAALEWQAHEFEAQTGIRCRVKSALRETILDQGLNTAFFRIFQETLTNVIRHANATKVEVRLSESMGDFVLEVRDDGRGISEKDIQNTTSTGLLGMRERAVLLRGKVDFHGEPGKGTTVIVRLPRPPKKPERDRSNSHENSAHRRSRRGPPRPETNPG
ncbi:MAG TPA: histidine kinase [Verrucomicrobiae bacterium]|nr:histidine kinase [Verrucomicrobiae bacterium]